MVGGPLGLSFASYIRSSRSLYKWAKPLANWYANISGYRKMGFVYDDLLLEERPDVQKALSRLTPRESYDRIYRIRRGSQASIVHHDLPKEQWTKPEDDVRYLTPYVSEVHKEDLERSKWDTMQVKRK
ncbi:14 kDa subunit of cytochrome bd ubiquinol oxidase [Sistotremastrum niveocremeum HHB9708]|uniref:Cytochrome b-c1 complex subunit 7 n=2 Tax=Sistotremastraceae TaxID=3402574 RepID=A0A164QQF8_9AGAM|nr:14 kDa subunit of cytochrome bd ubiquinol oxidase [Sistotremastrum niveocremeum HHB9708]KZT33990.1 14 kDa subunit of cytochrome bd ubiquinol oxidase [Sistotremastrum suecicum HHB10207 ss-3]